MKQTYIDIEHIPFSRYGAMLSISKPPAKNELMIHDVSKRCGPDNAIRIIFTREDATIKGLDPDAAELNGLPFRTTATPTILTAAMPEGKAVFCLIGDHRLSICTQGVSLIFFIQTKYGYGLLKDNRHYEAFYVDERRYAQIECQQGAMTACGPMKVYNWNHKERDHQLNLKVSPQNGILELELEIGQVDVRQDVSMNVLDSIRQTKEEWTRFLAKMPSVPPKHQMFAQVTWFNLWSSYVHAQDVYKTDIMLMSKKFMSSVWSWDHCFNALSMAFADQAMAINQFYAPFWLQNRSGVLPDMWNPNSEIVWGVTKPPIHGWCISKLMDRFELDDDTLTPIYTALVKWTNWWLQERDEDQDGIPAYPQGCDSGWDNATVFDLGFFTETPDLPAYLILQMHALARIARRLYKAKDADDWTRRANKMLEDLLAHCWTGEKFVAKLSGTHEEVSETHCLINYMPLVLGSLLPAEIAVKTVERMQNEHMTAFGLATEKPGTPKYDPDGYWRGPIWAPTTYLIVDGLRRMGQDNLAIEIARRFCDMCAFHAKGNYENFDALTGLGLRAPGYTWTASVYMLLLTEYGVENE